VEVRAWLGAPVAPPPGHRDDLSLKLLVASRLEAGLREVLRLDGQPPWPT